MVLAHDTLDVCMYVRSMYVRMYVLYTLHASALCSLKVHLCHDINHLSDLLYMCRTGNLRDASFTSDQTLVKNELSHHQNTSANA